MTRPRFDLIDQPWIPVEGIDGKAKEVGLAELFDDADRLWRIVDPSPLVTIALYRLAFAVFHRAVPLEGDNAWLDAWDDLDAHLQVGAYLERWRHRFDLFDAEAPFWQVTDQDESYGQVSWTKLAMERNPNTSKLLFDHTTTGSPPTAQPAIVARALAACQMFAVGAGKSKLGYTFGAPVALALCVVPEGDTMSHTLIANAQVSSSPADLPIWEMPSMKVRDVLEPQRSAWNGPASRLTWPARAVRIHDPDADGAITWISFAAGIRFDVVDGDRDPWVAHRVTKQGQWISFRLDPARSPWRQLHAMVVGTDDGQSEAAPVMTRLPTLEMAERAVPTRWTILVAGQAADKAKIELWGQERWVMPSSVLSELRRGAAVTEAIDLAAQSGQAIGRFVWNLAKDLLAPHRSPDVAEIRRHADAMPVTTAYWSTLENLFAEFLLALEGEVDIARARWHESIAAAVRTSAAAAHTALGRDARALRAWARSGPRFERLAREHLSHAEHVRGGTP